VNVVAISTPLHPDWRWRIVNFAGEVVEESTEGFPTIGIALAAGVKHRRHMNVTDHSTRPSPYSSSTSHLRVRWPGRPTAPPGDRRG
jgi:hypothetical protein